jgi:hypothetical protein
MIGQREKVSVLQRDLFANEFDVDDGRRGKVLPVHRRSIRRLKLKAADVSTSSRIETLTL